MSFIARRTAIRRAFVLIAGALVAVTFAASSAIAASKYKVLYSFCTRGDLCPDGGLVEDAAGNQFGAAGKGGDRSGGTVFELASLGTNKWKFHRLYSFCAKLDCADGYRRSTLPPRYETLHPDRRLKPVTHAGAQ